MKKIYLFATIIAIITGFAVFLFASQLQKNSMIKDDEPEMVSVVVAASNISANSTITFEMLTTVSYLKETVPVTAITDINEVIGKNAKYPIFKSEQILPEKIFITGQVENEVLAARIKDGYRAFTIAVDNITGIAGNLTAGDKIDLIITRTVNDKTTTSYLMQNINIIAIGSASQYVGNPKIKLTDYSSITLEVLAEDCVMLNHNIINGFVKIVLRGIGDEEIVTVPVVNN